MDCGGKVFRDTALAWIANCLGSANDPGLTRTTFNSFIRGMLMFRSREEKECEKLLFRRLPDRSGCFRIVPKGKVLEIMCEMFMAEK
jgi:hypothetical protein